MEIELKNKDIVPPYNFEYTIKHYNIYPWFSEKDSLFRILKLKNKRIYLVEIQSIGSVDKPKLILKIMPKKRTSLQEINEIRETLSWCLGLKEDYRPFYELCEKDKVLSAAMESRYGSKGKSYPLVFEAIIGVICAQNIQFRRLYSMMYNLCATFGEKIRIDEQVYYCFPSPENIAKASLINLRKCKVGYRDKFIKALGETIVNNNLNLENLKFMSTEEALKILLELPGVGPYTANLVLSVGLRRKDRMHLDRYVREAMYMFYFNGKRVSDEVLIKFANKKWHGFQSLIVDALSTNTEIWAKKLGVDFKFRSGAQEKDS